MLTTVSDRPNFAYYGDNPEWLVAYAIHRDSDALERSNFRVIRNDLETNWPDDVTVETFSHWLVGHTEELLVRPGTEAARAAEEWRAKLDEYPVADEEDWSNEEHDESIESIAEFVYWELPFGRGLSLDTRREMAGFIVSECEDPSHLVYAWPDLEHVRDRRYVARGIRAYRRFTREHKGN